MNSMVRFAITLALVATASACPEDAPCTNDFDCAVGERCSPDGTCEAADPNEPEGPAPGFPETTLDAAPEALTNDKSPSFVFSCDRFACGFECSLDNAPFNGCRSPVEPGELPDGDHTFAVRAIDGAFVDASPAEVAFTIDTQAPVLEVSSGPLELTQETTATFTFRCDTDCSLNCAFNGESPQPCVSPFERRGLQDGAHNLVIVASDTAGNASMVEQGWTVDTIAPVLELASPGLVGPSAEIAFSSPDATTFECSLDGAPFEICLSPVSLENLSDGEHTFSAIATDEAGNASDVESMTFDVDAVPPVVVLTSAPPSTTPVLSQDFSFECTNGESCTFLCAVDDGPAVPCSAPYHWDDISIGAHVFTVVATDSVGNTSSPLAFGFTARRVWTKLLYDSAAIANDGTLWCFGYDWLCSGRTDPQSPANPIPEPIQLGTKADWKGGASIAGRQCVFDTAGDLYCWGVDSEDGMLGQIEPGGLSVPTLVSGLSNVSAVALYYTRACAVAEGGVYCWGGSGSRLPTKVPGSEDIDAVDIGVSSLTGYLLAASGELYQWGRRRLSSSEFVQDPEPIVHETGPVLSLDVSPTHLCYVTLAGSVFCDFPSVSDVEEVETGQGWAAASYFSDVSFLCAMRISGEVLCRYPLYGDELGLVPDLFATSLDSFSNGRFCSIDVEGAARCWVQSGQVPSSVPAPQTPAAE